MTNRQIDRQIDIQMYGDRQIKMQSGKIYKHKQIDRQTARKTGYKRNKTRDRKEGDDEEQKHRQTDIQRQYISLNKKEKQTKRKIDTQVDMVSLRRADRHKKVQR